jgi:ABC-2 type transport system permease protein
MCDMFDALLRILALTRKELLAILKDPRSRFSLLLPPILQCLIYGYVATYDLNDVPYAVLDQDRSAASQELLAGLDGSGVFRRVANLRRAADIKDTINERRALLVIQIDQDFERRLLLGAQANVQVIADGRNSNTAGTALGYVNTIVETFNTDWRSRPADPAFHARVVQPESRDPLAYDPGVTGYTDAVANAPVDRIVRRS